MKIIFLLDNNEFAEVDPTKLQLRQLAPGQAALGITVNVPQKNEDGSPKMAEDGTTPLMQEGYRSFVNYAVNLSLPAEPTAEAPTSDDEEQTIAVPPPDGNLVEAKPAPRHRTGKKGR